MPYYSTDVFLDRENFVEYSHKRFAGSFLKFFDTLFSRLFRSSRRHLFYKKAVLKNLAKFSGKSLYRSLFLIKI